MNNHRRKVLLAALAGGGAVAWATRPHLLAHLLGLRPAENTVRGPETLFVTVDDGVSLATDLYRPRARGTAAPRRPTILVRTPYGRANAITRFTARRFAERGYNVAFQDVRGRGASGGTFIPYENEARDGAATIAWLAEQPWSDGQVAMAGASYLGYAQWAAATTGSPHLKAIVPHITMAHLGYEPGQPPLLDRTLRWMLILDALDNPAMPRWRQLARAGSTWVQDRRIAPGWDHLPLDSVDEVILGRVEPFYRRWLAHQAPDDPFWTAVDHRPRVAAVTVPAHFIGGWYDIFLDGLLADYMALAEAGRAPYLTIGPWTHLGRGGELMAMRLGLDWFDAHLLGRPGRLRAEPVLVYVMGADEWQAYDRWPPSATRAAYFLQPDGRLDRALPPADGRPATYDYDPANPTPNIGGPLLSTHAGPRDNRALEARPDVLTYTTPPLERPLEIIGPVRLDLYARSSREHADFFARLCDVQPDGRSLNICDGIVRVEGEPPAGGDGAWRLSVALSATAYRFAAGHRLRLQISSGAHPRFARQLGSGASVTAGTRLVAAEQTVFHDAERPSALVLSIA